MSQYLNLCFTESLQLHALSFRHQHATALVKKQSPRRAILPSRRARIIPIASIPPDKIMSETQLEEPSPNWPALMKSFIGTWEGRCCKFDPSTGKVLDSYMWTERLGISGTHSLNRITNTWDDGKTMCLEIRGELKEDGRYVIDTEYVGGSLFCMSDTVGISEHWFKGKEGSTWGIYRLLNEKTRARTWQVVENGKVVEIVQSEQTMIDDSNPYFEPEETKSEE